MSFKEWPTAPFPKSSAWVILMTQLTDFMSPKNF